MKCLGLLGKFFWLLYFEFGLAISIASLLSFVILFLMCSVWRTCGLWLIFFYCFHWVRNLWWLIPNYQIFRFRDMRMEISLVRPSYMMLHPTWSVTRYFFHSFNSCTYQNKWTWVTMILSGRRVEPKTSAYSWLHCILCWAGRNIWASSTLYAGIVWLVFVVHLCEKHCSINWRLVNTFHSCDNKQVETLEDAIAIVNRNRYLF